MSDVNKPLRRESRVRTARPVRAEYAETQAVREEQAVQPEVVLVQQQRLEELQECQRRLTVLVEGYLLALEQADGCRDVRSDLELGAEKPQELSRYRFWDRIRRHLDEVQSFAPDLVRSKSEMEAAVRSFKSSLERAKAEVNRAVRQASRLDEVQRERIVKSVLGYLDQMVGSATDIARECKEETLRVLGQIERCIERILEQPRPDGSAKVSSQAVAVEWRLTRPASSSKGQAAQPDRWMRSGHDRSQTRKEDVAVERRPEPFILQITGLTDRGFEVRALKSPKGEPHEMGMLPYDPDDLIVVLKLLELGYEDPGLFNEPQRERLWGLGLVRDGSTTPDLLASLGKRLYQALFPGEVHTAFQAAFHRAREERVAVALQLRFDEDAVDLARYPWELLHDGKRHLLSGGLVEMTRYIAYSEAVTGLEVGPPWHLLFIAPRPRGLTELPGDAERSAVWESLQPLDRPDGLRLERLEPPTYEALLDRLRGEEYHIIHFDGHGFFARRCPRCGEMLYPHLVTCRQCGASLEGIEPLGYLAFEERDGRVDYVNTEAMENLLVRSEVRLTFLSACQSAVVRGRSLFGGLGPGLIGAGVPSVVAMQFPVSVEAATEFARGFYKALARFETVPRAVAEGRMGLFRSGVWYVPVLYLRSTDEEGRLFVE